MLTIILLCSAICCLLVVWQRYRMRLLRATHNIPRLSRQLPILGIAHRVVGDNKRLWELIQSLSAEINDKGGIVTTWLGPTIFCIAMTDPDLSIVTANSCLDKPYFYHWGYDLFGEGLLTSNGDVWKPHRKLLNPAFNQNVLNGFIQVFNQQSNNLVKKFLEYAGTEEFSHRAAIAESSLEIVCQTAMGLPGNENLSIVTKTYLEALDKVLQIYFKRLRSLWKHPQSIYNWTSLKREENSCIKILQDVTFSVLNKSKESIKDDINMNKKQGSLSGTRFKPFFYLLLEESEKGLISDKEIRDEVEGIIAAGYDTTATSLVVALVMVGSHTEIQEKIYKELQEVFGETGRDVTKDDLPRLVYLEAVIKESLRLHPVVPVIGRCTDKDVQIGDITLPADSQVFLSIWGINRHPCWGPDRNEFVPDRWLNPDTLPSNPNAFAAFAIGKRMCLGRTYAMMLMKVTLVHILRKYRVKADHTKLEFDFDFVIKPVAGNQISIELR